MFLNLQKNKSQKELMLKIKQRQFWNLHQIPHKTIQSDFQFSAPNFFLLHFKGIKNVSLETLREKKIKLKFENRFP